MAVQEPQKLTKKERDFCRHWLRLGDGQKAAVRAGYLPEKAWETAVRLLQTEKIIRYLESFSPIQKKETLRRVQTGLERLAFGSDQNPHGEAGGSLPLTVPLCADQISSVDLFQISELQASKDGGWKIKFHDRQRAMDRLLELAEAQNGEEREGSPELTSLLHVLRQQFPQEEEPSA